MTEQLTLFDPIPFAERAPADATQPQPSLLALMIVGITRLHQYIARSERQAQQLLAA